MQQTTVVAPRLAAVEFVGARLTGEELIDRCRRLAGLDEADATKMATDLAAAAGSEGQLTVDGVFVCLGKALARSGAAALAMDTARGPSRKSVLGTDLPAELGGDEVLYVKDLTLDEVKKKAPPGTSQRCAARLSSTV